MPWHPANYEKFKAERFQPFDDLAALVRIRPGLKVIDLGCGMGELTRRLADRLPESEVLGIDNSPQMLEKAKAQVRPGLAFERRAIEEVSGRWDLVFSNAAIQWVRDHESLVPRLCTRPPPRRRASRHRPGKRWNRPPQDRVSEGEGVALEGFFCALAWPMMTEERNAHCPVLTGRRAASGHMPDRPRCW